MKNKPWIGRALSIIGIVIMLFGIVKMTRDDSSNLIYTIIGLFLVIAGASLSKKNKAKSEMEN